MTRHDIADPDAFELTPSPAVPKITPAVLERAYSAALRQGQHLEADAFLASLGCCAPRELRPDAYALAYDTLTALADAPQGAKARAVPAAIAKAAPGAGRVAAAQRRRLGAEPKLRAEDAFKPFDPRY